jgi:UDP-N-acetylglucosamine--N-acetylmuramyl-(pentapeptide) pyrophosphoryl-undecaprenol N-acetylglucosamine transferase
MASWLKIPTVIQEQNSFPGKTNLLLAKKASLICTAYPNMEVFFPKDKIIVTGNPVRTETVDLLNKKEEGLQFYGLEKDKQTILIVGGSLGARTLNEAVRFSLEEIIKHDDIQVLWQCGNLYFKVLEEELSLPSNVKMLRFIERMDLAYAAADVIVSRAGATSISELSIIGKPTILVPSPNVSEDHQTKNAMVLVNNAAAVLVKDAVAKETLFQHIVDLLNSSETMDQLSKNIKKMGMPNATEEIVNACQELVSKSIS